MQPHCVPSGWVQYPGGVHGCPGLGGVAGQVQAHGSVVDATLPGGPPVQTSGVWQSLGGQTSLPHSHCWAPPQAMTVRHEGLALSPYEHVKPSAGHAASSAGAVEGH